MKLALRYFFSVTALMGLFVLFQNCGSSFSEIPPSSLGAPLPITREALATFNFPMELSNPSSVIFVRSFPNLTFNMPMLITSARDQSNRLFVLERAGKIRVFPNSQNTQPSAVTDFLDLTARVSTDGEQGLLGLAFPPDFKITGYFFVHYSPNAGARRSVFSRFKVAANNPNVADPASETVVLEVAQDPNLSNHKGGSIHFGPDGYLYLALGDGGGGGDPLGSGQNLKTLLGKVMRIDVSSLPYSIPADNPLGQNRCAGGSGPNNCGEIWAYGFRNPFRWSFDRATGDLLLADVGQDNWEEINIVRKGGNYGWNAWEGNHRFTNTPNPPVQIPPIFEYSHTVGQSITGGFVYRGSQFPALRGAYIYGDFNVGQVWALLYNGTQFISNTALGPLPFVAGFGEDEQNELYGCDLVGGRIMMLANNPNATAPNLPTALSQTGLFKNLATLTPAAGMIEYEVNSPLWSDGARKRRWMGIPTDGRIQFSSQANWKFPSQSVMVKHFELTLANGQSQRLETRVMIQMRQGWTGFTYKWNASQTDATLLLNGGTETFQVLNSQGQAMTQTWSYPSTSACMRCHTETSGFVLGVQTAQINRNDQLTKWNQLGLFQVNIGSAASHPALPSPEDASRTYAERARSYLHTNCAVCHQPGGTTAMDMDLRYSAPNMNVLNVVPTAGDLGLVNAARVRRGSRASSVLFERMQRTDSSRMPPLGSSVVDPKGLDVVGRWIDGL